MNIGCWVLYNKATSQRAPSQRHSSHIAALRFRDVSVKRTHAMGTVCYYTLSCCVCRFLERARRLSQGGYFECNDSINNVGSQARVDFGGANQPKGSEERSRTC